MRPDKGSGNRSDRRSDSVSDKKSMEDIYQKYAKTVYKYLMSLTRSEDLAEELTQETFYQAIRSIERFDGSSKMSTWLCAIAKNVLFTYRRKHPEHEDIEEIGDLAGTSGSAEERALEAAGIDPGRRAETLTLAEFAGLADSLQEEQICRKTII